MGPDRLVSYGSYPISLRARRRPRGQGASGKPARGALGMIHRRQVRAKVALDSYWELQVECVSEAL